MGEDQCRGRTYKGDVLVEDFLDTPVSFKKGDKMVFCEYLIDDYRCSAGGRKGTLPRCDKL